MKETRRKLTIDLPGIGAAAEIVIEREGQRHPSEGDEVRVIATLVLPATQGRELISELRFGSRVRLFNWPMHVHHFLYSEEHGGAIRQERYIGTTWKEAFDLAETAMSAGLQKLIDALQTRKAALEAAEGE